jgi:hypothetical protein
MLDNGRADNNFVIWSDDGAGGADAGFLRIFPDRLEWGYASASRLTLDTSDNTDALHDFRVAYDGQGYAVWRDSALIADGLAGDATTSAANLLVLGDFSSSGISTAAVLDHAAYDISGAFAVVPEPGLLPPAACCLGLLARAGWRRMGRRKTCHDRNFSLFWFTAAGLRTQAANRTHPHNPDSLVIDVRYFEKHRGLHGCWSGFCCRPRHR